MPNISRYNAAIYRVTQSLINYKLRNLDIKSGQQDFLYVISQSEGISQIELSNFLYVGKSTTAKALKNLTAKGYVTRKRDENDKRVYHLYLTEKGKQVSPKIRSTFLEIVDIITKDLTEEEAEQTLNILKRILGRLYEEKNSLGSGDD